MSLKKAIEHGKERRKMNQPLAPSCRHHGNCSYCSSNRLIKQIKDKEWTKLELKQHELHEEALQAEAEERL